ncbi:Amyloid-beta A4 precursor protein-binding A member 1, partial [Characodon lateralis]|nr:Amyloid-beta A4 precursor protein-binding A member 1 [Characodon lateralis]
NFLVLSLQSPCPDSPSPPGAESSSRLLSHDEGFQVSPSHKDSRKRLASFPTYVEVPGPCDPDDLIDGIIFAASCLGSTQLLSEKTPSKNIRMMQAQEAVSCIKAEPQPITEVDIFISTQRIKVLNADSQETMIDHALRTISYIADIGNIVVLMARRRLPHCDSQKHVEVSDPSQDSKHQHKMICHVFESEDAQMIAQSIGQAFSVAYQEFLRANGINPEDLSQTEYSDLLSTQDMYNEDLVHFSRSENCKDVFIEKVKGEILGVVIVESGWGSILPTVIIANMMHAGPAERSGKVNIGDQIMSVNGTSLIGLPLSTCQSIIKDTGPKKNNPTRVGGGGLGSRARVQADGPEAIPDRSRVQVPSRSGDQQAGDVGADDVTAGGGTRTTHGGAQRHGEETAGTQAIGAETAGTFGEAVEICGGSAEAQHAER